MAKILIIEDDKLLNELVRDYLLRQHHQVETAETGTSGLEKLQSFQYDAVILDWQLPGLEGIEILKRFRANGGSTPVLMLTRKGSIDEKEAGFQTGTDDYLTKPFELRELGARVQALLRRPKAVVGDVLRAGSLMLDEREHKATKDGSHLQLLPKEFALLAFFMRHQNDVFSAQALLERVWDSDSDSSEEAVSTCIRRLRKKIDDDDKPSLIQTVHGLGYKFVSS